ncbi:Arginase [Pelagimonas phthalicica]|uniref:Arginase n=1 Tax=Pelagimonas phthalicica TaxID=1037362 RepID=A0A238JIS9_9RHOB|nr:arginase [Pelagimonas phthalicica]TDS87195.1 arginase [Pelagimonas phthalicica]SMX30588.1 Arginase [Pelagimonas phthalicica]
MTKIVLLGAPIEAGTGRRGCVMGPDAYRTAGLVEELRALGHEVTDMGDAEPEDARDAKTEFTHLKELEVVAGWTRALHADAKRLGRGDALPIYLGGDHALSAGTVTGHAAAAAEQDRPFFVLWLDAHADFNTFATTTSGNLHGTPLAFACGLPGFDAYLNGPVPVPVNPENVCILGLRSVDGDERRLLQDSAVTAHDMRAIDELGIVPLLRAFLDRVRAAKGVLHVSLDVDFIEPDIAPAVGTTVPGGATFREAHHVMELLHDSGLVTSLDLVELNPFLDVKGRTARLMVDLTASLFGRRILDRATRSY